VFAAELLMPLERVRALYLDQHIPANQLAGIFDVSNAAMLNRLAGLLTEPATERLATGRPQESPWTNDAPIAHENDEEATPYHSRGDPLWSPGVGGRPPGSPGVGGQPGFGTIARKQYDEFQLAAIEAATPALIVAGPGSGKTST